MASASGKRVASHGSAAPPNIDFSTLKPFELNPGGEFWMRHPSASGRVLQDLARTHYVIAENAVVKFFGDTGEPLLRRHKLNRDKQKNTVQRYCQIICERGIQKGARPSATMCDETFWTWPHDHGLARGWGGE